MRLLPAAFLAAAALPFVPAPALADEPPPAAPVVERGRVGFAALPVKAIPPEERAANRIAFDEGVVVTEVTRGGPAEAAGLRPGDRFVRYRGKDVPDSRNVRPGDDASIMAWMEAFQKVASGVKAGDRVEIEVERDGKPATLVATAITEAAMRELETKEAGGGDRPAALKVDFSTRPEGKSLPEGFVPASGAWSVVDEPGKTPPNPVLKQGAATQPWAVVLVTGRGRTYGDATARVRFQPVSGEEDASGGIVFRARDAKNYYFVRANALEDNLRIYVIKDGARTTLASATVTPPALGAWHTLEVTFAGTKFKAVLDGKASVEATDATFLEGSCGLWTKADSVTLFDDFVVDPVPR